MMRIVSFLLAFVVTFLPMDTRAHPPTQLNVDGEKAIAEEIKDFRKRLADAIKAKDAVTLRKMYADTFQHTHTSAKTDTKDTRIVSALTGDPVIETAEVDNLIIRAHGGGWVALAFGSSPIKSMVDGKIYSVKWTAVYVRTEQSWQLVASQATRAVEAKP